MHVLTALRELAKAARDGYHAAVAFVIQMDDVAEVRPNTDTPPAFDVALQKTRERGVKVLCCSCNAMWSRTH